MSEDTEKTAIGGELSVTCTEVVPLDGKNMFVVIGCSKKPMVLVAARAGALRVSGDYKADARLIYDWLRSSIPGAVYDELYALMRADR